MVRVIPALAAVALGTVITSAVALAQEPAAPQPTPEPGALTRALEAAWNPPVAHTAVAQRRPVSVQAGPNIGAIGLGAVGGLTEFELGPSLRYWMTDRFGLQAHLGFGGDKDFLDQDVKFLRFEPTFIVAIGDFGDDAVNVRPYAGGGIRVFRTDIGSRFDDTTVRPAAVGGVEFGFRGVPRLKASGELSLSSGNDLEDFNFGNGPSIGGARVAALVHYFFD